MRASRKIGFCRIRPHVVGGKRTGRWILDIPAAAIGPGSRKRKIYDSEREVVAVARRLKHALELRALGLQTEETTGWSLPEAVEKWTAAQMGRIRTRKKRRSSLKANVARLKNLLPHFGDADLSQIQECDIEAYQERRLNDGRQASTINTEVATLLQVLRWTVKQGYLKKAPTIDPIPSVPPSVVIPTKQEVSRIIERLPENIKAIVWFLASTGCRWGEAANLTWERMDEVNGIVEIAPTDGWGPKTDTSTRKLYISGELLNLIRSIPKQSQYVFSDRNPDRPRSRIHQALNRSVRQANVTRNGKPIRINPHILRKAHATWLAMDGVPHQVLQTHLGHARGSRVTDQYYVFATDEAQRAAVIDLPVHNI